jgi:hypothetical protein
MKWGAVPIAPASWILEFRHYPDPDLPNMVLSGDASEIDAKPG